MTVAADMLGTSWAAAVARSVPAVQAADTLPQHLLDSVVVESPLPDPFVPVVQWIFQQPGWVMVGGIILGVAVGALLLRVLWRRRRAIGTWLVTRKRGVKVALVGTLVALLLAVVGTGAKAYDYMMHDNDFCRGCHIFVPSGQLFVPPDTGTYLLVNQPEGKHDTLSCHACHPFEFKTQARELFYWMTERPEKIPPHAKVPRTICEQCHVTGPARELWQRVNVTAGHRTHLESDSSALRDVVCLTCHARTAHRFQPADTTCAQQGCHFTDSIRIRLGRMRSRFEPGQPLPNEELLYCNSCHQFTVDAQFVAPDSATGLLRPGSPQCFGCHEMRLLLATFDPAKEPHAGSCGMCHNAHTDVQPKDALKSCTDAGCHDTWRDVPFHVGQTHAKEATRCQTCHLPHAARVDASDCVGCHRMVRRDKTRRRAPPLPFDTTEALRQTSSLTPPGLVRPGRAWGQGDAAPPDRPDGGAARAAVPPTDTFPHERHRRLACLTCHDLSSRTRRLTFEPPRGCQICHHQRPARNDCATCHRSDQIPGAQSVTVRVGVPDHLPRLREVRFEHEAHRNLDCTACHSTPVSLAPADSVRTCATCHDQHHAEGVSCATCHRTETIGAAHQRPVLAHQECDACHTPATVARLVPVRSFCLTCHSENVDHYPPKECTVCHFQTAPSGLRPQLGRAGPAS